MSIFNFTDKHNANKKLSIYTSIITFILGVVWISIVYIYRGRIPSKEEAIAFFIILAGVNLSSSGSDLRGFLKILKGGSVKEEKKESNDN
ncbi:endonuclease [Brachyspira innocens]|uniref:endonuclease n=1 Tax=Brachyspira innocens TaxID=13264 RepID=UPI0026F0D3A7|nr:endonuclease [Brachyspira innocens]MDO6994620.1 endonuclease [Brachyspira innocens]